MYRCRKSAAPFEFYTRLTIGKSGAENAENSGNAVIVASLIYRV
jgi:hypothetical protein